VDRAKAVFLALVVLCALVGLIVWVHTLDRRTNDLEEEVQGLSNRLEAVESRGMPGRGPGGEGMGPPGRPFPPGAARRSVEPPTPTPPPTKPAAPTSPSLPVGRKMRR
jgi:hypothetical protein